mgnify:CR=1 FL=1
MVLKYKDFKKYKVFTDNLYASFENATQTKSGDIKCLNNTFDKKIYIADFFFTTCPTICPVMKKQMRKVYEKVKGQNDVAILSHTIDPEHDTPSVLKEYATDLGVKDTQWMFVTGDREKIYEIGEKKYLVVAGADSTAPGGYIHSGAFVLIDKEKRVRGMYNGTDDEATKRLIGDIARLKAEYSTQSAVNSQQ